MAVLKRAAAAGALGLVAASWLGCDLGLDPSMIGESASSGATSSSSSGGEGGASTTTSSTSSGGGGGAGGAGAAGGGGAGGEGGAAVFGPCAPIDDFTTFENSDPADGWQVGGKIDGVNVNGNRMVRAEAEVSMDATMQREQSSSLEACYVSVRVDPQQNPDTTYLSLACGAATVRFRVDQFEQQASVDFVSPPASPPSLPVAPTPPLGGNFNPLGYTMRVRFTDEVVFEIKPAGATGYTATHGFARPSWMNDCRVGFGVTEATQCRFDDFCVDAP